MNSENMKNKQQTKEMKLGITRNSDKQMQHNNNKNSEFFC